jgi:prophage regulatory protein
MYSQLHKIVLPDFPAYCGLKRSQIEEMIARGDFPRPVKLNAYRKGWLENELISWQQRRIALRDMKDERGEITSPVEGHPALKPKPSSK